MNSPQRLKWLGLDQTPDDQLPAELERIERESRERMRLAKEKFEQGRQNQPHQQPRKA